MAKRKRFKTGEACAYCTKPTAAPEREHVFPRTWYPSSHRSEKLQVPSCRACNADYARLEQRLFFPLVAAIDPPGEVKELIDDALRGLDPKLGRGVRDVSMRRAQLARVRRAMHVVPTGGQTNAVWTPGEHPARLVVSPSGLLVNGVGAITIRDQDLPTLATKFARGTYRALSGKVLPSTIHVNAGAFTTDARDAYTESAARSQLTVGGAPPFEFAFKAAVDEVTTRWFFRLWGFHWLYAFTGTEPYEPAQTETSDVTAVVGLDGLRFPRSV